MRPIVGRETELVELLAGLDEARQGRGGVWFVTGEPGIGKTRLVEEVAERALEAGSAVHWGRCWEAGGAPAFWPWIEVLRALLRTPPSSLAQQAITRRARVLSQLLPELASAIDGAAGEHLGGERGRFELLEALACSLCDAARDEALVLVIEDLHVADDATVSVLELLQQQARSSRLSVIGTLRDADARLASAGGTLERLARGPRRLELGRLGKAAVGEFLARAAGAPPSAAACDAVHRVTEGNPLFLVEVSRLLSDHRGWHSAENLGLTIPRSIRHAIRARLGRLSARARDALEVASVIGRQFRAVTLAGLAERTLAELAAPLAEALDEGILSEIAPAEFRFSHVLLREVLHLDLDEERRAALHWEAAGSLRRAGLEAPWSEIAHHLLEAGPSARDAAVDACEQAARESLAMLAFSDAVEWFTRALAGLGQAPSSDVERRGPLLVALAEAQFHAGDFAAARATCRRALDLARTLGDGELFARAALVCGTVLQYAVVDPALVEVLREALAALPEGPSALRAIVMARLAAAEQPAPEPETFFELAREAIAMARTMGDPGTLLDTLRYAISALMDLAPPHERLELNREYVRLAQARQEPLEALRGSMRQAFDQLELGDLAAMAASIQTVEELGERFGHPFYTWRAAAFRALQAIFAGSVVEAEEYIDRAERLGQAGRDPTVATTVALQRYALARALRRDDEVLASMARISPLFAGSELGTLSVRVMTAEALLRLGRREHAAAHVRPDDLLRLIRHGDVSTLAPLANITLALGLPAVADAALALLDARPRAFASGGMTMMTAGEPVFHIRATLHRAAGRWDDAERDYALALEQAEQARAVPFAISVALDYARLLSERHGNSRGGEVERLCARALAAAERLGAEHLVKHVRALLPRPGQCQGQGQGQGQASEPGGARDGAGDVAIERDGESWLVRSGALELRLADSKGVKWLAQLVSEPGREFHVLELSAAPGAADGGDAGELLDPQARKEYRERVQDIELELAESRAHNDAGRACALAEELEFLKAELSRALGLGGRERRAGSAAERARINVQRRLRDALRRITLQHAELGQRLERSLKTGLYCSYRP